MILLFGGTTEGRRATEVLEEAGSTFYYSTKTGEQVITLHHGTPLHGAMDEAAMLRFCYDHDIRLIIDAAHPFAEQLHSTIARAAARLSVPVIRYERIYPPRDPRITWIDDYEDLQSLSPCTILATTGVQSIERLKPLETKGFRMTYRILQRDSSLRLAHRQGAADDQLCFYHEGEDEEEILKSLRPDILLVKESGASGGFVEKTEAALRLGIRVVALKRPSVLQMFNGQCSMVNVQWHSVNGPHGLRRKVEQLLPEFFPLHSGLTTGTCATAAVVAAAIRLTTGETPSEVPVILPDGETIYVPVHYGDDYAYVIKDAGDDPDVTNGMVIKAETLLTSPPDPLSEEEGERLRKVKKVTFSPSLGGGRGEAFLYASEGIGTITLPGFDYPPGSPAINRVPREMIEHNLKAIPLLGRGQGGGFSIVLSVPGGADIARRTFNPRLGIEGGISIIGTSGITRPFSEQAFIDSIRKCITVAAAADKNHLILNSGAKSEQHLRARFPDLPTPSFVHYGNYIGEAIRIAAELRFTHVTLGVMLGKAVKLAAGQLDTHSRNTTMDTDFIAAMLTETQCPAAVVEQAHHITLARELWNIVPPDLLQTFAHVVIEHCHRHCDPLLPNGHLDILLIDEQGNLFQ